MGGNLIALLDQIVTKPLHNHIALPWSHRLIIDTNDQGHACLLDTNASSALQGIWKHRVNGRGQFKREKKFCLLSLGFFKKVDLTWVGYGH
jgi:hypothetical protein